MNDWNPITMGLGEERRLHIGPLTLAARRERAEWRLTAEREGAEGGAETQRFVFARSPESIRLVPAQADRPVIVRPLNPFTLSAGEQATLFVSLPLWLKVEVEVSGTPRTLLEMAVVLPSDTWFGPSTREGELCYAGRTRAVLDADEIEPSPSRAVTPLHLVNRADSPLLLERVRVPAPSLSIFGDAGGRLWGEGVTLARESDGEMATLKIGTDAPAQAGTSRRLAKPRQAVEEKTLIRAFGGLFR